jgi:hypothetical protein
MLRMASQPRWSDLYHAYGIATDTPRHLAALLGDHPQARDAALIHLFGAIIHQGTPWSATAPTARTVVAMLDDPRLDSTSRDAAWPTRASLLDFLALVGEAADYDVPEPQLLAAAHPNGRSDEVDLAVEAILVGSDDPWGDDVVVNALEARAVLDCRRIAPEIFDAVLAQLDHADARVRMSAANALRALVRNPALAPRVEQVRTRVESHARRASTDERAALVLTLGQLGCAPREFLADTHPGVRACAALAPALAGNASATEEILSALRDPAATETWFGVRLPQLDGRIRFALTEAAISRVDNFDALAPAAAAVARTATTYTVDRDWGPFLLAAFPDGVPASSRLSRAQRDFLVALVGNDELWNRRHGNAMSWFRRVGLRYDRAECARLAYPG